MWKQILSREINRTDVTISRAANSRARLIEFLLNPPSPSGATDP